jgi:hypothetical protein
MVGVQILARLAKSPTKCLGLVDISQGKLLKRRKLTLDFAIFATV